MPSEERRIVNDYLCAIESLIIITRDSCERHLYTAQYGALDVACKYFTELDEILSHWDG